MTNVLPEGVEQQITTTETDLGEVAERLTAWLTDRLGPSAAPAVSNLRRPTTSGMSSISILFDLAWTEDAGQQSAALVARLAPEASAFPVFPGYDLQHQADVMNFVATNSAVPVPRVRWVETSAEPLGTPFLVMEQVSGVAAADNPPYVFGGWLAEMSPEDQRAVERVSIRTLAEIHSIPGAATGTATAGGTRGLRAHFENERAYYEWTRRNDGLRIPVLERAFEWLEEHWPTQTSEDVLCWGDSRIGNILFDGPRAAAVLDWESATLAPRELDLGWFIFFHRMFQDVAEMFQMPGLPHLFRRHEVVAQYEAMTGTKVQDLDFYLVYAALRHGTVMAQIKRRSIHFGEAEVPDNPDDYVMHAQLLADLMAGTRDWSA